MDRTTLEGMNASQLKQLLREKDVAFNDKDGRDRLLSKAFKYFGIQVEKGFFAKAKAAVNSLFGGKSEEPIQPGDHSPLPQGTRITDDHVRQLANRFFTNSNRIRQEIRDNQTLEQVIADQRINRTYRRQAAELFNLPFEESHPSMGVGHDC